MACCCSTSYPANPTQPRSSSLFNTATTGTQPMRWGQGSGTPSCTYSYATWWVGHPAYLQEHHLAARLHLLGHQLLLRVCASQAMEA